MELSAATVTDAVGYLADVAWSDAVEKVHSHPLDPIVVLLKKDATFRELVRKYDIGRSGVRC